LPLRVEAVVGVARAAACVKHKPHAADMQARACERAALCGGRF